jgi:hypothetical protein
MKKAIVALMLAGSLSGCWQAITGASTTSQQVNGDLWYSAQTYFLGLGTGSVVRYCAAAQGGPATCTTARFN